MFRVRVWGRRIHGSHRVSGLVFCALGSRLEVQGSELRDWDLRRLCLGVLELRSEVQVLGCKALEAAGTVALPSFSV